jgi:Holliday junction resolvasome RuvABC endonuclease subunit
MCLALRYLLAVDPSLTCSGWALFSVASAQILGVGKIRSLPASVPLGERLLDLQNKIEHILTISSIGNNDVLVCEAPTTMRDPHAAIKVEQVRGLFEVAARARSAAVPGRINPRSVQFEVMGLKGKQLKRSVIKETASFVVSQLHGARLKELGLESDLLSLKKNQDIVDAILIGTTALHWISAASRGKQTLAEYFHRPSLSRRRFSASGGL